MEKRLSILAGAGLAILAIAPRQARSTASFGVETPAANLNASKVTLNANGSVTYDLSGSAKINGQTFIFSAVGSYDPKSGKALEKLTEQGGNTILSNANCFADPWQVTLVCTDAHISSSGYNSAAAGFISNLIAPLSANSLTDRDRQALKTQYQDAVNARNAAEAAAAKKQAEFKVAASGKAALPTPTPTPLPRFELEGKAVGKIPSPTPTTPARALYPPYGASYAPSPLPSSLKVNQAVLVSVTVRNLSSQTWPAGGVFHLSYHWYRGAEIVHDGARTLMTAAVAPGGTLTLNANVTAPPSAGAATLKWDMVKEGTAWFSDEGVAMSAPLNATITP